MVAIDPNDLEEPILIKDLYKVARNNFKITAPREASFPSITNITVTWDLIPESVDAGEEKI